MDLREIKKTSPRGLEVKQNLTHTSAKATSWLDPRDLVTTRTTYIIIIIIGTFILVYILLYSLVLLYPVTHYSLILFSFGSCTIIDIPIQTKTSMSSKKETPIRPSSQNFLLNKNALVQLQVSM